MAYVEAQVWKKAVSSGSSTVAKTSWVVSAGSLLVAVIYAQGDTSGTTGTVTISDGTHTWTAVAGPLRNSQITTLNYVFRVASATAGTYTVTATHSGTPNSFWLAVGEYTGPHASPDDGTAASAKNESGSASNIDPGAITTTTADGLVVGICAHYTDVTSLTANTGFTKQYDEQVGGAYYVGVETQITTSAAAYSAKWTQNSGYWGACAAAFKAAAATFTYPQLERSLRGVHRGVVTGSR